MTSGRHVALVGTMGSGKTSVGARVAEVLGLPFCDNDDLLEQATGMSAHDVREHDGVEALHRAEVEALADALRTETTSVVAAAASTIEHDRCRELLRARAFVVWLRADPAVLARRAASGSHRPLEADAEDQLRRLAARRDPLYRAAADVALDVGSIGVEDAARAVADAVRAARTAPSAAYRRPGA